MILKLKTDKTKAIRKRCERLEESIAKIRRVVAFGLAIETVVQEQFEKASNKTRLAGESLLDFAARCGGKEPIQLRSALRNVQSGIDDPAVYDYFGMSEETFYGGGAALFVLLENER